MREVGEGLEVLFNRKRRGQPVRCSGWEGEVIAGCCAAGPPPTWSHSNNHLLIQPVTSHPETLPPLPGPRV